MWVCAIPVGVVRDWYAILVHSVKMAEAPAAGPWAKAPGLQLDVKLQLLLRLRFGCVSVLRIRVSPPPALAVGVSKSVNDALFDGRSRYVKVEHL